MNDVTRLLSSIDQGDPTAAEQLLPLIYDELRMLAAQKLKREASGQTLQATALVHEAYLRLIGAEPGHHWDGRGHFFAAAAEAMRRILVENARRKRAEKRGGTRRRHELLDSELVAEPAADDLLDLDEALTRLAEVDARAAELVQLRVFAGMSVAEVARHLGISPRTAKRSWAYARAWLVRAMAEDPGRNRG